MAIFPFIKVPPPAAVFPPTLHSPIGGRAGLGLGCWVPMRRGLSGAFRQEIPFYKSHLVSSLSLCRRLTPIANEHSWVLAERKKRNGLWFNM